MKAVLLLAIATFASMAFANWDDGLGYKPSKNELRKSYDRVETTTTSCGKMQRQLLFWGYIYTTTNGQPKNNFTPLVAKQNACVGRQTAVATTVESRNGACELGYRCVIH